MSQQKFQSNFTIIATPQTISFEETQDAYNENNGFFYMDYSIRSRVWNMHGKFDALPSWWYPIILNRLD